MIQNRITAFGGIIFTFVVLTLSSCNNLLDNSTPIQKVENEQDEIQTIRITLDVSKIEFDSQDNGSRSTETLWESGDKLYLRFHTNKGVVVGDAIYDNDTQDWILTYQGTLNSDIESVVEITYIAGGNMELDGNKIKLDGSRAVYQDLNGAYIYSKGPMLFINASLQPITSRIRFKGNLEDGISVGGLKIYNSFDISSGQFTYTNGLYKYEFLNAWDEWDSETEYTDYIYGVFMDSGAPQIKINDGVNLFTADFSSNIMLPGKSGYMNIPTEERHNGWQIYKLKNGYTSIDLGHEFEADYCYIDLALPSGTLWCLDNLGSDMVYFFDAALLTDGIGESYCWGEGDYKCCYTKENIQGSNIYDAAKRVLKGDWCMPTVEDFEELIEYGYWDWDNCRYYFYDNKYGNRVGKIFFVNVYGVTGEHIEVPYKYTDEAREKEYSIPYWTATFDKKEDIGYDDYYYAMYLDLSTNVPLIKSKKYAYWDQSADEHKQAGYCYIRPIVKN